MATSTQKYSRPICKGVVNAHTDRTRIFLRTCEMKQLERSVSKVNEY